jgi:hypothetical protein
MISRSVFVFVTIVVAVATAFAPSEPPTRAGKWSPNTSTYTKMKRIGLATAPPSFHRKHLSLSADPDAEADQLREQAQKLREENTGTVYDDEDLEAPRENVSSAMKERLTREASSGLDSEKGQTNVILYISVAVVVLVALGGSGILY